MPSPSFLERCTAFGSTAMDSRILRLPAVDVAAYTQSTAENAKYVTASGLPDYYEVRCLFALSVVCKSKASVTCWELKLKLAGMRAVTWLTAANILAHL